MSKIVHIEIPAPDLEKTRISAEFDCFALFTDISGNRMGIWSKE